MKNNDFKYDYNFADETIEKVLKEGGIETVLDKEPEISFEMKMESALVQFVNDIYEIVYNHRSLNLRLIEKSLLNNLLKNFNQVETAKLSGITYRTITSKKALYRSSKTV